MYNNNYGKKKSFDKQSQPQRPKKEIMVFPIATSFKFHVVKDNTDIELDRDNILNILSELQEKEVFSTLTENVSISKALVLGDSTKKGSAVVGFINSFDFENDEVEITIYGTSVENITALQKNGTNLVFEPKVIAYNGEFKCFNGFNLVEA